MFRAFAVLVTTVLMLVGCGQNEMKYMDEEISSIESKIEEINETTETATETTTEATTVIVDTSGMSNEKIGWYFNPNDEHTKPVGAADIDYLKKYSAYYVGTTDEKVIYLTFDEGYENGYSSKILDVLKNKNVQAAFFVTKPYIEQNPELIMRMVEEGHIVGNHSVNHKSSPGLSDDELRNEITETAECFKELTGQDMPKVFRPPMGEFSERTIAVTQGLGYKTILWSFAHRDWLTNDQPGKDAAYNTVMKRYHNGCVMLLHAVSSSNTEALPDIIDSLRENGYEFRSLEEIE